jgi:hypothetical protein
MLLLVELVGREEGEREEGGGRGEGREEGNCFWAVPVRQRRGGSTRANINIGSGYIL